MSKNNPHTCRKRPKGTKRKPCEQCAGEARFIASIGYNPPAGLIKELLAVEARIQK